MKVNKDTLAYAVVVFFIWDLIMNGKQASYIPLAIIAIHFGPKLMDYFEHRK